MSALKKMFWISIIMLCELMPGILILIFIGTIAFYL